MVCLWSWGQTDCIMPQSHALLDYGTGRGTNNTVLCLLRSAVCLETDLVEMLQNSLQVMGGVQRTEFRDTTTTDNWATYLPA